MQPLLFDTSLYITALRRGDDAAISLRVSRLNAQTLTSGGVTGVITDQSFAVLPNADVEIRDVNKGTTALTKTDRDGLKSRNGE